MRKFFGLFAILIALGMLLSGRLGGVRSVHTHQETTASQDIDGWAGAWVEDATSNRTATPARKSGAKSVSDKELDMTQLVSRFPSHKGATMLYLNFDGWTNHDQKGHKVEPFRATSGSRQRDIQEILYRTSEIFAPFNVRVVRIFGDGKYDNGNRGSTTVFIGADTANIDKSGHKYVRAVTPGKYADSPRGNKQAPHQPNSDPFDIAFVDPIGEQKKGGGWSNQWSNVVISRKIAHESGHTFGLVHVLSNGFPELMSYDAEPRTHFSNRTFEISDLNYDPVKRQKIHRPASLPKWNDTPITTENAFTYLLAALGPRPADDQPNVADRSSVDPAYEEASAARLAPGETLTAAIRPKGDYDVFRFAAPAASEIVIRVRPTTYSSLKPVLFVFDSQGQRLVEFGTSKGNADRHCDVRVKVRNGGRFQAVVGSVDNATTGEYQISILGDRAQTVSR